MRFSFDWLLGHLVEVVGVSLAIALHQIPRIYQNLRLISVCAFGHPYSRRNRSRGDIQYCSVGVAIQVEVEHQSRPPYSLIDTPKVFQVDCQMVSIHPSVHISMNTNREIIGAGHCIHLRLLIDSRGHLVLRHMNQIVLLDGLFSLFNLVVADFLFGTRYAEIYELLQEPLLN